MVKRGLKEVENTEPAPAFVTPDANGDLTVIAGKYAGYALVDVPYGYVKHFVLSNMHDELTQEERKLCQQHVQNAEAQKAKDILKGVD